MSYAQPLGIEAHDDRALRLNDLSASPIDLARNVRFFLWRWQAALRVHRGVGKLRLAGWLSTRDAAIAFGFVESDELGCVKRRLKAFGQPGCTLALSERERG